MIEVVLIIITVLGYGLVTYHQFTHLIAAKPRATGVVVITATALIHSILLYRWIDGGQGQNLALMNILSLLFWLAIVLILLISLKKKSVLNLLVVLLPIASLTVLGGAVFPGENILYTGNSPKQLGHILLSVVTFAVLCVAGLQSIFVSLQDYVIRQRPSSPLLQALPPLQTMEIRLYRFILMGFLLLTAVIASSIWFFYAKLFGAFFDKTFLSLLGWGIFAVLLVGRYFGGWRGPVSRQMTVGGVLIVLVCCCLTALG